MIVYLFYFGYKKFGKTNLDVKTLWCKEFCKIIQNKKIKIKRILQEKKEQSGWIFSMSLIVFPGCIPISIYICNAKISLPTHFLYHILEIFIA